MANARLNKLNGFPQDKVSHPVVRGTEQAVSPTHLATELFSFAVMGCGGGGDQPLGLQCSLE